MKSSFKIALLWFLFGIVCLLTLGLTVMMLVTELSEANPLIVVSSILFLFVPVTFMGIGVLIVSRMPRHTVGWLAMLLAIALLFLGLAEFTIARYPQLPPDPPLMLYASAWFAGTGWMVIMMIIFLIALLFPTGKPPSPRWRWLVRYGILLLLLNMVLSVLASGWENYAMGWILENPIGLLSMSSLETSPVPGLLFGILAIFSFLSVIVRYRHGEYVERQQIKWFLLACGLFVLIALSLIVSDWGELDDLSADLYGLLFALCVIAFPVAIGIAILRYQLFDIDVIIRKTLVYAVLTGLLALIYLGTVIILQSIIGQATGEQSPLIIVVSTLLIAALFSPLRRRIQSVIDRRFYRKKYDAQQVLEQFAQTARDETDMDVLTAELARVVQETMQPSSLQVWLQPTTGPGVNIHRQPHLSHSGNESSR